MPKIVIAPLNATTRAFKVKAIKFGVEAKARLALIEE